MLRGAWIILAKDLRLRLRDRSVLLFAFVVPLALTFVFAQVFPADDDLDLAIGLVDLDAGEIAAGFTDGVVPSLLADGLLTAPRLDSRSAAQEAIAAGELDAAWILPPDFTQDVTSGAGATLPVLVGAESGLAGEVARGVAEAYVADVERISLAVRTSAAASAGQLSEQSLTGIAADVAAQGSQISVSDELADNRQLDAISYLAAGMAVFFLFFTVTFGITGFLEERQQGTLPRLLASPIGVGAIHLGKALGAFALGIVSMTVLSIASTALLGASWGDPAGVAILIVAGVISALGVMALVGSFARTAEQASNLQSIVALVFGLAGGVFFPVGAGFLSRLALLSPHGWFLRGLGDLAGADSWTAVLPAAGALVTFGLVAAVPGVLRLRRETI